MITKYKKVSIIYGRGGRECALQVHRNLCSLHEAEGMPVESRLLAEELLSSADILSRVREIISSSSICIILLTFDDAGESRVRQNVLVEIGMALVLIGREKCFAVCEKPFLPDDFPSDIRGALNPNYMEIRDAKETAERITFEIKKKLSLKTHNKILEDQSYVYDYMKVLSDIPVSVFEEKPDLQMAHILDCWQKNVNLFTYTEERICYILERVVFFPIFPKDKKMKQFLEQLKESIRTEVRDFSEEETEELIAGRTIITQILEYAQLRQLQSQSLQQQILRYDFCRIADELEECVDLLKLGDLKINWYLQITALDYAALARMQAINIEPGFPDERIESLKIAIDHLENIEILIKKYCLRAGELWSGYVQYNLSRAYERLLYAIEDKDENEGRNKDDEKHKDQELIKVKLIKRVRECSLKAISIRRRWIGNGMKGIFSTALSYEYFLALKHEYELCKTMDGYSSEPQEKVFEGIRNTLEELTIYCKTTGLERLFAIRDSFEQLMMSFC